MKLSIIIPVYNAETTLNRCLASIQAQAINEKEIIIVNDGSSDQSMEICQAWAVHNPDVKIIHQPNGGLSAARNRGMEVATGEWLTFVDADDFLQPNTYAPALNALADDDETDLLEFSIKRQTFDQLRPLLQLTDQTFDHWHTYWFATEAWTHCFAWNKIYRRSMLADCRFPKGKNFEDLHFMPIVLQRCRKVRTFSNGCYVYVLNPKGITQNASAADYESFLEAWLAILQTNLDRQHPAFGKLYAAMLNTQIDLYERTRQPPRLPVLPYQNTLKLKILQIIGLKRLCQIIAFLHRFRKPKSS